MSDPGGGRLGLRDHDLRELEALVARALETRSVDELHVVGFGEISVALGWPVEHPSLVCKRMAPASRHEFDTYRGLVVDYIDRLRAAGVDVVDTAVRGVERGRDVVTYLVQPRLPADQIGSSVLSSTRPDAEHPFLRAVVELLDVVDDRLSIDAQVTNFAWDGETATLIDVGTPFMWDATGELSLDMDPFLALVPAPTRGLMRRELRAVVERWKDPRSVGVDIVANLLRAGLDDWAPAMIEALDRGPVEFERVTLDEARASLDEDEKVFPLMARLQKVERFWQTAVRRRPYDFFVNTSYGGGSIS